MEEGAAVFQVDVFQVDYQKCLEKVMQSFAGTGEVDAWVKKFNDGIAAVRGEGQGLHTYSYAKYHDSLHLNILLSDVAGKYLRLPNLRQVLSVYIQAAVQNMVPYMQGNIVPVAAIFVEQLEQARLDSNKTPAEVVRAATNATSWALEGLLRRGSPARAAMEGRVALLKWPICAVVEEKAPQLYEGWFGKVRGDDAIMERTRRQSFKHRYPRYPSGQAETQTPTYFQDKFFEQCSLLWMQEPSTEQKSVEAADEAFTDTCLTNKLYISYVARTATALSSLTDGNRHMTVDLAGALVEMLVKAKSFIPSDNDNVLRDFSVWQVLRPDRFTVRGAKYYAVQVAPWTIHRVRPTADARKGEADWHADGVTDACVAFCAQMRIRALRTLRRQRLMLGVGAGVGAAALGLGYAAWTNRRPAARKSPRTAPARGEAQPVHSAPHPPLAGRPAPSSASNNASLGRSKLPAVPEVPRV